MARGTLNSARTRQPQCLDASAAGRLSGLCCRSVGAPGPRDSGVGAAPSAFPSPRTLGSPRRPELSTPTPAVRPGASAAPPAGGTRATSWAEAGTGGRAGGGGEGGRFRGPERLLARPLPLGAARLERPGQCLAPSCPARRSDLPLLRPPAPGTSSREAVKSHRSLIRWTHEILSPSPAHPFEISLPSLFPATPSLPCAPSGERGRLRTPREGPVGGIWQRKGGRSPREDLRARLLLARSRSSGRTGAAPEGSALLTMGKTPIRVSFGNYSPHAGGLGASGQAGSSLGG